MKTNERKFYVYIHYIKDTTIPFYVGKGHSTRFCSSRPRNKYWKNIVDKYGFEPLILEDNLNEEDAFIREEYWYNKLSSKYELTNIYRGGYGGTSWKKSMSDETKKKISLANTGEKNASWGGATCTESWRRNQRKSQTKYKYKLIDTHNNGYSITFDSFYEAGEYLGDGRLGYRLRNYANSGVRYKHRYLVEKIKK